MSYSPRRAESSSSSTSSRANNASRAQTSFSAEEKKKKKTLVIVIVAILCLVIVVSLLFILAPSDGSFLGIHGAGVFTGGNNNGEGFSGNGITGERQTVTTNITPYYKDGILPTAADRHDIAVIENGGKNASDLHGTWKLDQGTTYMFDGYGRGIMLTGVDNYTFVYSAENGKLCIDMDTIAGNDYEYDYSISGDTLTMTRDANTFTLTKIAE